MENLDLVRLNTVWQENRTEHLVLLITAFQTRMTAGIIALVELPWAVSLTIKTSTLILPGWGGGVGGVTLNSSVSLHAWPVASDCACVCVWLFPLPEWRLLLTRAQALGPCPLFPHKDAGIGKTQKSAAPDTGGDLCHCCTQPVCPNSDGRRWIYNTTAIFARRCKKKTKKSTVPVLAASKRFSSSCSREEYL